jgi:serine phosphatase RsbU (regulator of sigma subunit)
MARAQARERGGSLLLPAVGIQVGVLALLVAILGFVAYGKAAGTLEDTFESRGADLARSLAVLEPRCWSPDHGTSVESLEWLAAAGSSQDALLDGMDEGERARVRAFDGRRRQRNRDRAEALSRSDGAVLAVVVATSDGGVRSVRGGARGFVASGAERELRDGVTTAQSGKFGGVPALAFATKIPGGGPEDRVTVVLEAGELRSAKGGLAALLTLLGFLVVAGGAAAAYGLLGRVLGPLSRLTGDLRAMVAGQMDRRIRVGGGGEIARLGSAVEEVGRRLTAGRVLRAEQEEVGRELALGAEVQSSLLPDRIPMLPGLDVGAYYRPSGEVGGDYYDFLDLPGGRLGIGIFDVSGHGVPGAIVMAMARSLLHEVAPVAGGPAETLRRLNAALHRDLRRGMFMTGIYAEFDAGRRILRLANAGHNPVLFHRSATRRLDQLKPGGPALGLAGADRFDKGLKEAEVSLDLGDRVVLYTDGAVEVTNPSGDEYGEGRFQGLVALHAAQESNAFVNLVIEELETFRGDAPPEDDMTVITFAMTV